MSRHVPKTRETALHAAPHRPMLLAMLAAVGALLATALMWPVGARADDAPQWQGILALQLQETYNCTLEKVLFSRDVPLGETSSTEGRARCFDGREYDFTRTRGHEKFTLRLCQPTVC